jgi:molybdenum cofactor cytidylyltransferase
MTAVPAKKSPALGVVILGAGASSRMGQPKLLLPWRGTTIIGHLIGQWRALEVAQIAVVHRPNDTALAAELDRLNFPVQERLENPQPERGMFSSILCAAKWAGWQDALTAWAIVLGDQPHLRPDTLRALLAFQRDHPEAICQPVYGARARHPVILPRRAFDELKQSRMKTLKEFLKQTSCQLVKCPAEDSGLALDLDRPEDYKKAVESRFENL